MSLGMLYSLEILYHDQPPKARFRLESPLNPLRRIPRGLLSLLRNRLQLRGIPGRQDLGRGKSIPAAWATGESKTYRGTMISEFPTNCRATNNTAGGLR